MKPIAALAWQRPCPVCSSSSGRPLWLNRLAPLAGLDMSYEIWRCDTCGFHYAARLPPPESYDRYYSEASKYDLIRAAAEVPPVDRERADAALRLCVPHVTADDTIVDIGCGCGTLLHAFARAGYARLAGIDPAPAAAERARQAFGLEGVIAGFFHDATRRLPLAAAGLVCLTGILEHLPSLHDDMASLFDVLPPTARVLIEVPALERFARDDAEPFGEFSLEHIQYFGAPSLSRFMAGFGYRPVELEIVGLHGATDSLFGLFERKPPENTPAQESPRAMDDYIAQSQRTWRQALERITAAAPERFFVYGAGSHTARLLPALTDMGLAGHVVGIVDANPNLHGKTFGGHVIGEPGLLAGHPGVAVLISSHKAQDAIARVVRERHPVILPYR